MNKRIEEFIEQATTEEHDGFRYFDKKKFAELVIMDVASKLEPVLASEILELYGVEE